MDLVGLYVHSEAKAGRDAGELCGLDPVGVEATRDTGSGANVVATRGEFNNPDSLDSRRGRSPRSARRSPVCAMAGR